MKFEELMFYAEAEGLLPTREGKINAVIRDIKNLSPTADLNLTQFKAILSRYGLNYDDLTNFEKHYICKNFIKKRLEKIKNF